MRQTLTVACALVLATGLGRAEPAARPNEGPVARWEFDGRLTDNSSSGGSDWRPAGGRVRYVSPEQVGGVRGQALALGVEPGDVQLLTTEPSADLRLGASYTIEAWILPTRLATWNRLLLRWGGPRSYAYHMALHEGRISLAHGQADGQWRLCDGDKVEPGRWHHVVAVARRDQAGATRSTLTVYVNGRPGQAVPFDGTIGDDPAQKIGLGDDVPPGGDAVRFRGYVDELTVWKRALGAEEIRSRFALRAGELEKLAQAQRQAEAKRRLAALGRLREAARHRGARQIVFAERGPGRDIAGHYYANFGYACTDPSLWFHARDGGRLCLLDLDTGELRALVDDAGGGVRDPCVHYDADKVLFSYRKAGSHHYNLYEVGLDGRGLRQLTDGPWDDVEPAYLPDGGIVFASSRCKRYIGCWLVASAILHRCDGDGRNIRPLSSGSFTENTPCVLGDGRILYTRWEYVNRDAVSYHHLWTMSPDGTAQMVYYGNGRPGGVFIDAQAVPGGSEVVFTLSPGHGTNEHGGSVAVVRPGLGPDSPAAVRVVAHGRDFRDPFPLGEERYLAARGHEIVLLDEAGGCQTVYRGGEMVHEPRLVARRPRERVIHPQADLRRPTATLVLADAYAGRRMETVKRGSARRLLVMEELPKPANYHGGGSQPIGHGVTSTLKRVLGTVPVEADGSAHFEAPALRSLYFALLDENDLCIKQMRSFVTLQPGETAGCVGCHEPRTQAPAHAGSATAAAARPASRIEPAAGAPDVVDFPRDVQPVLDRHCAGCHNARDRKGGVVLSGDRGVVYSLAYYELLLHWQTQDTAGSPCDGTGRQHGNDEPYGSFSGGAPLMRKIDSHHHDVKLSAPERTAVRLWIDTASQYAGTYAAIGTGQIGGCWGNNRPVREMADNWPETPACREAVERRCAPCHGRMMPRHATDQLPLSFGDMLSWERPLSRFSRHRLFNLTRPEASLILLAPLAKAAGGYATAPAQAGPAKVSEDRRKRPTAVSHPVVFAGKDDPDFGRILAHVRSAGRRLNEIKRFDMAGFRPREEYVREMKRYGVLEPDFDLSREPIDVYLTDRLYWKLFEWPGGR